MNSKPTARQIKYLYENSGYSIKEAEQFLTRKYFAKELKNCESVEDIKHILLNILEKEFNWDLWGITYDKY